MQWGGLTVWFWTLCRVAGGLNGGPEQKLSGQQKDSEPAPDLWPLTSDLLLVTMESDVREEQTTQRLTALIIDHLFSVISEMDKHSLSPSSHWEDLLVLLINWICFWIVGQTEETLWKQRNLNRYLYISIYLNLYISIYIYIYISR